MVLQGASTDDARLRDSQELEGVHTRPDSKAVVIKNVPIDLSHLPPPQQVFNSSQKFQKFVTSRIDKLENRLQRPLTPREIQAFYESSAKGNVKAAYWATGSEFFMVALYVGTTAAFRRKRPQLPDRFLGLTGGAARFARVTARVIPATIAVILLSGFIHDAVAEMYMAGAVVGDPALKSIRDDFEQSIKVRYQRQGQPPQQNSPLQDGLRRMNEENARSQWQQDTGDSNDTLPTSDWGAQSQSSAQYTPAIEDRMSRQAVSRESHGEDFLQESLGSPQPDPHEYDDASPVAKNPSSGLPIEGSWDRLRRRAAEKKSASNQGSWEQKRHGNVDPLAQPTDSFSFSKTDEERQFAQEMAQKEFDARIEQERQGRNFDERQSSKKW